MLYRPLETPARPSLSTRLWIAAAAFLGNLRRQHEDTVYLDSLSTRELADFGLQRRDERDYPSMR